MNERTYSSSDWVLTVHHFAVGLYSHNDKGSIQLGTDYDFKESKCTESTLYIF